MQLALRVDVDTRAGLREGVPRLLEIFKRYSMQVSFFVTFGPDNSGRAVRRLLSPSFVAKMWRTNPFRLYGWRTLLSGTILPSLPVGEGEPALLKDVVAEGHELGIHGYDHFRWQDEVEGMEENEIGTELCKALDAYEQVIGCRPVSSAAPGWKCTLSSLAAQDRFGFSYASDVRGSSAFLPVHNGTCFTTPQIPTTLPALFSPIFDNSSASLLIAPVIPFLAGLLQHPIDLCLHIFASLSPQGATDLLHPLCHYFGILQVSNLAGIRQIFQDCILGSYTGNAGNQLGKLLPPASWT